MKWLFANGSLARRTAQRMAVVRARARIAGGDRTDREADAASGQEASQVGRRPVRGVHGLCVPGGRQVGGEPVEAVADGAQVEAAAVDTLVLIVMITIIVYYLRII